MARSDSDRAVAAGRTLRPADDGRRNVYLRATALVAASLLLALVLMGCGLSISHVALGRALLYCGAGVANLGVLAALVWTVHELGG